MNDHETVTFPKASIFRLLPGWRGNLLIFGLLILVVLTYFFWQGRGTQQAFFNYAREHARVLAGVIEVNARGALLSQSSVEEILGLFMGNTARFVDYLDGIEPFTDDELAALAKENGLDGIFIYRQDGTFSMGPREWLSDTEGFCRPQSGGLVHLPDRHLFVATWPSTHGAGCVGVGLEAMAIEELQDRIGLDRLLETLAGLAGIRYVRLLPGGDSSEADAEAVAFVNATAGKVAEVRRPLGDRVLLVGLDATRFDYRIRQIRGEFFLFSAVLALLGSFFSWLLYRYQQFYFRHIRSVERVLAREREDAALGRSASTIAHEIRNPLNAIGMGLQRLQMEAATLNGGERKLVDAMLQALNRANGIVENMRLYAGPMTPQLKRVYLGDIVRDALVLYRQRIDRQGIRLTLDTVKEYPVSGDTHLLSQAVENLLKNSIEAQPDGGFLLIQIDSGRGEGILRVENRGFRLPAEGAERILEPYFTTKTRGTGLGLAIVRKTVLAHDGRMTVSAPEQGVLRVTLRLPLLKEKITEDHADTHC